MSALAKNEKIFEYYPYLPAEMRMVVVNEMEPIDRCRFTGCSKSCNKEGKSSRNYIESLSYFDASKDYIHIEVGFGEREDVNHGFSLTFCAEANKKHVECMSFTESKILWTLDLDDSTDLVEYSKQRFRSLLRSYQKCIKEMQIGTIEPFTGDVCNLENSDFEIDRLRNLEELRIRSEVDAFQIISKTQKTLETLSVHQKRSCQSLENCEQIFNVQHRLNCPTLKLNNEQFLRLSASYITLHIGDLTVEDIHKFIKSWQNGTLGRKVEKWTWELQGSKFDVPKLFKILEKENKTLTRYDFGLPCIKIRSRKDPGTTATLSNFASNFPLIFDLHSF